jgi:UDP-GlcNAc:undecaprenyl-phosphate GlcNAc-1-phosphate transferase
MTWMTVLGFALAFGGTAGLIPVLIPFARQVGLVDHPGGRRQHAAPTPLIGGLAMVLGAATAFVLPAIRLGPQAELVAIAISVGLLLAVGLLDDRFDLPWPARLAAQIVAALIFAIPGGVRIEHLGRLLGTPIDLGAFSVPFTVFSTVGLINAMNMIDGVDGLAGSIAFSALSMLAAAAAYSGNLELLNGLIAFLGAIGAFLLYNLRSPWRSRAATFMGNAGSTVLGLIVAWSSVRLTQNPAHPISPLLAPFLVAPPIIDCLVLMVRRVANRTSPFHADRNHMHHLLMEAGYSPGEIVAALTFVSVLLGAAAAMAFKSHAPKLVFVFAFAGMVLGYLALTLNRGRAVNLFARLHGPQTEEDQQAA